MEFLKEEENLNCTFSRLCIFDVWHSKEGTYIEKNQHVYETAVQQIDNEHLITNLAELKEKLQYICKRIISLWKKCNYTKHRFLINNSDWLNVCERIILKCDNDKPTTSMKRGRPQKSFDICSKRSKRRKLKQIYKENPGIGNIPCNSSTTTKTVQPIINENEALSIIMETNLSKRQYLVIKDFINSKLTFNMLPSYQKILKAKKQCYPDSESTTVSESNAEVELQSLLDHTANRLVKLQEEVFDHVSEDSLKNLVLIGKWGFDGSSGHSEYKQKFENNNLQDNSLFVTSYVPLQLVTNEGVVIWKNPRPSSTRFCRPIRFQFRKETTELSIEEERYIQNKIQRLELTEIKLGNKEIYVEHKLQLTMVDGKVCNALSGTSSAKCYICEAKPKEMNDIANCLKKPIHAERLSFGLSPLHSWIRFFEYFLHISYRDGIGKWQIRSPEDKIKFSERKAFIQSEFREKLGLIVDKPKVGGSGNSNDGNTARTFFRNLEISAEITGIPRNLLERCCALLQAISCGYNINKEKFKVYALETAQLLVEQYPWFNLPPSVHKILIHGPVIIEHALLSIGELSEEAAEAKNKDIKMFRLRNTRKISRITTNFDLIHMLLLSSDPVLSSERKSSYYKKKTILLQAALDLLEQ